MGRTQPVEQIGNVAQANMMSFNEAVTRQILSKYLGMSYNGNRDLYAALGYMADEQLSYNHYLARYYRQDIATRVIDAPCNGSWRNAPEVYEEVQETTQFEKDWKSLIKRLSVFRVLNMLDKYTGLGQYGILLLGFDGKMSEPVTKTSKLLYIRAYGEGSVTLGPLETTRTSPRYGLPVSYTINTANNNVSGAQAGGSIANIHHSRILHIVDGLTESATHGIPRMKNVFNRLSDLEKVAGGSAEMYWRGARPGYQAELDPESVLTAEAKAGLKTQLDEYENQLRRFLTTQGVKINALAPQISDPEKHIDAQLTLISAATNIPKRILSGSERGELASTQDQVSWNNVIQDRRTDFCEPCILRPFIERMIEYGVVAAPTEEYIIEWKDLFVIGDKDKADISKTKADAIAQYANGTGASDICPPEVFLEEVMGFSPVVMAKIKKIVGEIIIKEDEDLPEGEDEIPEGGKAPTGEV